jgi:hypothetical protein
MMQQGRIAYIAQVSSPRARHPEEEVQLPLFPGDAGVAREDILELEGLTDPYNITDD